MDQPSFFFILEDPSSIMRIKQNLCKAHILKSFKSINTHVLNQSSNIKFRAEISLKFIKEKSLFKPVISLVTILCKSGKGLLIVGIR